MKCKWSVDSVASRRAIIVRQAAGLYLLVGCRQLRRQGGSYKCPAFRRMRPGRPYLKRRTERRSPCGELDENDGDRPQSPGFKLTNDKTPPKDGPRELDPERFEEDRDLPQGPSEADVLARAIHEDYVRRRKGDGSLPHDDPALRSWEKLDESLRASSRDQAVDIARKLASIGCESVRSEEGRSGAVEFEPDEIEMLARMEHLRWVEDRLRQGWHLGPRRDVAGKRSPYLVPWDELSEEVRDLDRDSVRAIPRLVAELGLSIVRRPSSQEL